MLTIKEAMQAAAKTYKGGKRGLARALNRRENVFANKCTPGTAHEPTANDVADTVNETGSPLPLQAIAYRCGYIAVPMPRVEFPADTDMMDAIADLQEDFAETITEIAGAFKSGEMYTQHAKTVMREGLEDLEKLSLIVGHIYMMAEDREEQPELVRSWERLTSQSVPSV